MTAATTQLSEDQARATIDRNLKKIHLLLKRISRVSELKGWIFEESRADKLRETVTEWRAIREMHEKVLAKKGKDGKSITGEELETRLQEVKLAPYTRAYVKRKFKTMGVHMEGF